jgi:hypothetical protein
MQSSSSRSSNPCRSRKRPTRRAIVCAKWLSSALVGALDIDPVEEKHVEM